MIAIDTNVLVYAFDTAYPEKRKICKRIIEKIFDGDAVGVVTNQILGEFCSAVTRKIENPISKKDAQSIIGTILSSQNWKVFNYKGETVLHALSSPKNFWDALIVQTLRENNVQEIITENISHFKDTGVIATNPIRF